MSDQPVATNQNSNVISLAPALGIEITFPVAKGYITVTVRNNENQPLTLGNTLYALEAALHRLKKDAFEGGT